METRELPVVTSGVLGTADATMQGPVASVLLNILGEPNLVAVSQPLTPGSSFNSISLPIDANVSAKLKAKIWANEFLDFSHVARLWGVRYSLLIIVGASKRFQYSRFIFQTNAQS